METVMSSFTRQELQSGGAIKSALFVILAWTSSVNAQDPEPVSLPLPPPQTDAISPAAVENPPGRSAIEVIRASLFDDIYSDEAKARWTPLYLRTYFSEGWNTPFEQPTSSSAGAPRQACGWSG
jgi:hypothetical protein